MWSSQGESFTLNRATLTPVTRRFDTRHAFPRLGNRRRRAPLIVAPSCSLETVGNLEPDLSHHTVSRGYTFWLNVFREG